MQTDKVVLFLSVNSKKYHIFWPWLPVWSVWLKASQHPYRTLWGRAPSPEILPCLWPCRCRFPRHPVGCCGWLTCCVRLQACWKCTAPTAPAAALSCTNTKQKHTPEMSDGGGGHIWQPAHTWQWPLQNSHRSTPLMLQMYNLSTLDVTWSHKREAKCRQLDFEAISIYST